MSEGGYGAQAETLALRISIIKNRHLHFELVDLIFQKEDFLVFGVGVHASKAS